MDAETATILGKLIGAGLSVGLGAIGPGIGIGVATSGALQSMARNPDMANQVVTYMFVGIAFAEALAIFGLVIGFILLYATP